MPRKVHEGAERDLLSALYTLTSMKGKQVEVGSPFYNERLLQAEETFIESLIVFVRQVGGPKGTPKLTPVPADGWTPPIDLQALFNRRDGGEDGNQV